MHDLTIRPAAAYDSRAMARLLNAILETGGTTAMTLPVVPDEITTWTRAPRAAWHVAERAGEIVGFQWIEPSAKLPPQVATIATFTAQGQTGMGIGSSLFAATEPAARALRYLWINADIRADNTGGLAYYQSRGFRDWRRVEGVLLADGTTVDKVWKRYDLD
jgi:L-amino acid N-acyltransferase YncA